MAFKVTLTDTSGFSSTELDKLDQAVAIWERVWNSDEFKARVLGFGFNQTITTGTWPFRKKENRFCPYFRMTSETRIQVYNNLLAGSERLNPGDNGVADISITLDKRDGKSVIGYTYANTRMQWIYSDWFRSVTPADIAGNLAHEYCHKLGYSHEFNYNALRSFTVPYIRMSLNIIRFGGSRPLMRSEASLGSLRKSFRREKTANERGCGRLKTGL